MPRILFVDDEPGVLEGLRGMLRRYRRQWEMVFACGGDAALGELSKGHFDVVVSDMRMPGIDGAALLTKVQDAHPHIVRIVLSGQTDLEVSRRIVHVAHQFMAKPCESARLEQVVARACALGSLLGDPSLRQTIGSIGQLPMRPQTYAELVRILERPGTSTDDVTAVIERDPGATAKLLQTVNSAFFGLPRRVSDVRTAVSYLGFEQVKSLMLSIQDRDGRGRAANAAGVDLEPLQAQSLLASRIAARLLPDRTQSEDAATAALLANIGLLIMMAHLPAQLIAAINEARRSGRDLRTVELEVIGAGHAEIGAYMLGIWGLPTEVVEAVAHHHTPSRATEQGLGVVGAVHVASALAAEVLGLSTTGLPATVGPLDLKYLEQVGVLAQLPSWRALAEAEAGQRAA